MAGTPDPGRTVGAVLVGGASRRMGSDKATMHVDGTAMAVRVARAMNESGIAEVVTVGGPDRSFDYRHLPDRYPGEGPLGGIITALASCSAGSVLVAACDLPWVDASVFVALCAALGGADAAIAFTGRIEPMCALWRVSTCLDHLSRSFASGERAVHRAVDGLDVVRVHVHPGALRNVNTPDDLRGA